MQNETMENNKTELIIYQSKNGDIKLDVNLENETVWLSLEQMSKLFGRDKSVISRHIKHVFEEGELEREKVVAKFATTTKHGAIEKAKSEYEKFQIKELSPIEKEYLNSINKINQIAESLDKK